MTLGKISKEMQYRVEVLNRRIKKLKSQQYMAVLDSPYGQMSAYEIDHDWEAYRAIEKIEEPFSIKISEAEQERRKLLNMLRTVDIYL
jgi:hypothetical protein